MIWFCFSSCGKTVSGSFKQSVDPSLLTFSATHFPPYFLSFSFAASVLVCGVSFFLLLLLSLVFPLKQWIHLSVYAYYSPQPLLRLPRELSFVRLPYHYEIHVAAGNELQPFLESIYWLHCLRHPFLLVLHLSYCGSIDKRINFRFYRTKP